MDWGPTSPSEDVPESDIAREGRGPEIKQGEGAAGTAEGAPEGGTVPECSVEASSGDGSRGAEEENIQHG